MNLVDQKRDESVLNWLVTGGVMVFVMVIIGGTTRLTGSGLSIVEWNVIMGTIPPLNNQEWLAAFEQYKQFPQFNLVNQHMTLSEFKGIFFWEYFHRVWGRFIGLVFIVPFLVFLIQKRFDRKLLTKLMILLFLGAAQGAVGWFMVMSGLVDKPNVSHYRLTVHFFLALLLFAYILRLIFEQIHYEASYKLVIKERGKLNFWMSFVLLVLLVQVMFGGFMAGLKASLFYPTYPLMQGELVPDNLFALDNWGLNFFENPATINFTHRWLPLLLGLGIVFLMIQARKSEVKPLLRINLMGIMVVFSLQFILGVITMMWSLGKVPVFWGVLHQATAVVLFLFVFMAWLQVKKINQMK